MSNTQFSSWRELLGQLTALSTERQRVAEALEVNAYTVTRWINGETEPRAKSLQKLAEVFPPPYREQLAELIQAEFFPYQAAHPPSSPSTDPSRLEVPAEFLVRALSAYALTSGPFRAWSLRQLTLQQALSHLDPDQLGIQLILLQCVPPAPEQPVQSLVRRMTIGTGPWKEGIERSLLFVGSESLSGWAVSHGEPGIVQDAEHPYCLLPFRSCGPDSPKKSAAAWPLQREGKLAGCLLTISSQQAYFTESRLSCIEVYANTLALSFRDEGFYERHRVALQEMPPSISAQQCRLPTQFNARVRSLKQTHGTYLSEEEAEALVLQQMEAELLTQSSQ